MTMQCACAQCVDGWRCNVLVYNGWMDGNEMVLCTMDGWICNDRVYNGWMECNDRVYNGWMELK